MKTIIDPSIGAFDKFFLQLTHTTHKVHMITEGKLIMDHEKQEVANEAIDGNFKITFDDCDSKT